MLAFHRNYFVTMARLVHRRGLELKRSGQPDRACVKFVEHDHLMARAREGI